MKRGLSRRGVCVAAALACCPALPALAAARTAGSHGVLRLSGVVTAMNGDVLPFVETTLLAWERDAAGVLTERRSTRRQVHQAGRVIELVWDDVTTQTICADSVADEWQTPAVKRLGGAFAAGPLRWRGAGTVLAWQADGSRALA